MRRFAAVVLVLLLASSAYGAQQPVLPNYPAVRELRLGLVCYGGVSLAIYMYGLTREIHNLAQASAALECDATGDTAVCGAVDKGHAWGTLSPSAQAYYDALVDRWRAEEVRTHVVIDVISGTSAGGINGIVLAKALANNESIDALRAVWFEDADISRLATGKPVVVRAAWRLIRGKSALGGDSWLKELYQALNRMDGVEPKQPCPKSRQTNGLPTLMPPGEPLDLLVTATDFYGTDRLLEIGDPATSWETRHDHVFHFALNPAAGKSDFGCESNTGLAFAGRSSASFPVAFPAIRLNDLPRALGKDVPTTALARQLFADRLAESYDPRGAENLARDLYLVDGGVLDNYPFAIAFRRVSRRTPVLETRRAFIYLEPDPRTSGAALPPDATNGDGPTAFQMFWGAKAGIPGAEPIANDLLDIARHNQRVQRIADIVHADEQSARREHGQQGWIPAENTREKGSIAGRVATVLKLDANDLSSASLAAAARKFASASPAAPELAPEVYSTPDRRAIGEMRQRIEKDAASSPAAEEAYIRLRVHSVLDQLGHIVGGALCGVSADYEGPRTSLIRALVYQWAARNRITGPHTDLKAREDFLTAFDIGYLRRRLLFVSDWLNSQYDPKRYGQEEYGLKRLQVQAARAAIAQDIDAVSGLISGKELSKLNLGDSLEDARRVVCVAVDETESPEVQAAAILDDPIKAKKLNTFEETMAKAMIERQMQIIEHLYQSFVTQTANWPNDAARAVLARYLGFAYWDRVSYPYVAFSGSGDMTEIHVVRFSPSDATAISSKGAAKLKGAGLGHFGAFFSRDGREHDYLWGRFDGAERALALIGADHDCCRLEPMLETILKEEKGSGEFTGKAVDDLQKCVEKPGSC